MHKQPSSVNNKNQPASSEFFYILQPSPLGGIGVFAARDIPAELEVFTHEGEVATRILSLKDIPSPFIKYCIFLNDKECMCPERFDRMEIGWYLNHSNQPNIGRSHNKKLISLRLIKAGEEILMNYNELNEPEHLKDDYYRKK